MDKYIVLFSPVFALIGVFLGSYLTYRFGLKQQIKIGDYQKRQKVFGELMGLKFLITQLYVSRFEAFIFSDYHEARWKLGECTKESLDLQEAQRWMHQSEKLVLDIAKSNQALFETIGSIRVVFNNTPTLETLTEKIYRFKTPKVEGPPTNADVRQLESWKNKAVKDLQELVEQEYGKPIDNLLSYLATEIKQKAN